MKRILKTYIIFFMMGISSFAQTIYSNGTGGGFWDDGSTWQGGVVPGITNDVIIAGTDSVYTGVGAQCNTLIVLSGGKFATSVDTVQVVDLLTLEDDAWFYNATSEPNLPGNSYDLYDQSYTVQMGSSGSVGSARNSEFGNLVIMKNNGSTPGANLTVNGNLIVNNLAYNLVFRGVRSNGSQTHTVYGDVYILKGILSCVDQSDPTLVGIWNIHGNVYVIDSGANLDSRIGPFSSANAAGLGIFNIDGDLVLQGGRLQAGTSSSHGLGEGIINLAGNFSMDINSAIATNHDGPFSLNFVGTGTQNVNIDNRFQMSTVVNDTVKLGSTVVFDLDTNKWGSSVGGDFVVEGSLELKDNSLLDGLANFRVNSGGRLKIGSLDGLYLTDMLGNIQVTGTRTYDAGAYYEYKGNGTQSLGDGLPNPVNGFGVNNPSGIVLDRDLTVNENLNVINGDLELNDHTITLGASGVLSETSGNTVTGVTGKISITTDLNAPSGVNVGGLGAWISSGANLGNTTVERYHSPRSGIGNQGIARYFNIEPTNNSGLNADFRFYYDESELNGIPEANLRLFQSPDGSDDSWSYFGGSVNSTDNYVSQSGISEFSYWTLGDIENPLPVEESRELPSKFALLQNYPNPFNPETKIRFELPEASFVKLTVFNMLGEKVATLVNEVLQAGIHYKTFNGLDFPSGVYLYKLETDKTNFTKKMMLVK